MTETVYTLHRGTRPLLVSLPHVGTAIPADQRERYVERALARRGHRLAPRPPVRLRRATSAPA